jgi:catechol 2,3-dioxygenase-like lactoylglutathione lyase family enzyme
MTDVKTQAHGLSEIGQISLPIQDVKRAIAFYRDMLGMKFLFDIANAAFFDCAGVRLMLSKPETEEFAHTGSIIYYRVKDLQAEYELLSSRGVKFEDKPHLIAHMDDHDLWMAFFRDPDHNLIGLMSEIPL